ncbi:FecR family protein [Phytopseudomonas dryadis]|uniref:Iron dicitrate transport regulator FecR n=1 Tax=Phytopseudomonas dryadis TaxID=2487520 RepID=A0A4Q9R8L9_9GAMM|nr:FecR domain-containing protein [Pseudomonas dryadis]TBU97001.1 iron dicitrate transport regulator FecR [Pseudomonas dryadis]
MPRLSGDPVWEAALDWLLRLSAEPDNAELRAALAAWLAQSDAHACAYRKAEKVWRMTADIELAHTAPAPTPPVPSLVRSPSRGNRRAWRALAGGALAACLALAIFPDWQSLAADHASAVGEHRQVALAEGSLIDLDSDSAIDVHLTDSSREVTLLKGQAFFSVSHDPHRPFKVRTGDIQVTVTGTAFDVSLASRDISVAVQSGSVQVRDLRQPEAVAELRPGERIRYRRDTAHAQRDTLPLNQIAAWRQWQLLIDDRPLAEVIDELRRYQPGLILLNDEALASRRITASLDLRAPHTALQVAIEPLGGRLRSWGPYLLIVSGR